MPQSISIQVFPTKGEDFIVFIDDHQPEICYSSWSFADLIMERLKALKPTEVEQPTASLTESDVKAVFDSTDNIPF